MFLRMASILPIEMDISGIVAEVKRQLKEEADYLIEAEHLRKYRRLVRDEPQFIVPQVHDDLTTKRILAMDFLDGDAAGIPGAARRDAEGARPLRHPAAGAAVSRIVRIPDHADRSELRQLPVSRRTAGSCCWISAQPPISRKAFTERYGKISRALIDGDDGATRRYAEEIGYLRSTDSPEHAERVLQVIRLACEPICHRGVYDFGASDLIARARDAGIEMLFNSRGEWKAPPPETVFLHRKLVGSFLACARIRARVRVQDLIRRTCRTGFSRDGFYLSR